MKKRLFGIGIVLLALVVLLAACGGGAAAPGEAPGGAIQPIGQGDTVFRFEVTDADGVVTGWYVHTDEAIVGDALLEVGLIAGDESEWGLMVTQVNGIVADWDANQSFWAFYIDGDFAMAGVDATTIEPGVTYAFVYSQG